MDEEQEPLDVEVTPLYTVLLSRLLKFYKSWNWELVKYELKNNTDRAIRAFIETKIADLSYEDQKEVELQAKSNAGQLRTPPSNETKVDDLLKDKSVPLYYEVRYTYINEGLERVARKGNFDVLLLARNVIYWTMSDPQNKDRRKSLLDYLVEWIDPKDPSVQRTLKAALSNRKSTSIVQAIYEELQKNVKLTYLDTPHDITIPDQGQYPQVVRLPGESLENGFANCIDGAVLYASLIEAAGLDAIIVFSACKVENSNEFKDGHALVGWRKRGSEDYEFLETTMTDHASFREALKVGREKYDKYFNDGWLVRDQFGSESFAYLLRVKETRNKLRGITEKEKPSLPPESPVENAPEEGSPELETPFSSTGTGNHFAVVVGANSYQVGDIYHQKEICPYDAETLYQQLLANSFHPSHLHLLIDNSVELLRNHSILSCLQAVAGACKACDLFLFYYSGAIKQDEHNYFLLTYDLLAGGMWISLARVKEYMMQSEAQAKVILLDIYSTELDPQDPNIEKLMEEFVIAILEQLAGLTVLASYKKKDQEFLSSLFTHALIEEFQRLPGTSNSLTVQHIYDNLSHKITLYPPQPFQAKQTIVCRPGQEVSSYFLLSYRYLVHMQKTLEEVQEILMQEPVMKDHILRAIKFLETVDDIVQPEIQLSVDENWLRAYLYRLYKRVECLKEQDIEALLGGPKHIIEPRACSDVHRKLQSILYDVARKTDELRAMIMPGEA